MLTSYVSLAEHSCPEVVKLGDYYAHVVHAVMFYTLSYLNARYAKMHGGKDLRKLPGLSGVGVSRRLVTAGVTC